MDHQSCMEYTIASDTFDFFSVFSVLVVSKLMFWVQSTGSVTSGW